MATRAPSDYGVDDPTVVIEPASEGPIPGWRKPIALAGWGGLIAILIALIVWGIMQLMQGAPPWEPSTVTTIPPTAPKPSASSPVPVAPPQEPATVAPGAPITDYPTASTKNTGTPTAPSTTSSPSHGALQLPRLPSVITLPPVPGLPGLPTEITLRPPGF